MDGVVVKTDSLVINKGGVNSAKKLYYTSSIFMRLISDDIISSI